VTLSKKKDSRVWAPAFSGQPDHRSPGAHDREITAFRSRRESREDLLRAAP